MRCQCCNKEMSDVEAMLKVPSTGEFADLCGDCYYISYKDWDEQDNLEIERDMDDLLRMLNLYEEHRYE